MLLTSGVYESGTTNNMLLLLTTHIQHMIVHLGALGVFLASVLEEIIVPIPSTLVQAGSGLFLLGGIPVSFLGLLKLFVFVAFPSALGVTLGSLVIYGIIYYGESLALEKYGKYFFIKQDKLEKVRLAIVTYPRITLVLTMVRFIPLFPNVLITAACGLLKIPLRQYLVTTFFGILIRAFYLGAIGWLTGNVTGNIKIIDTFFGKIGGLILVLLSISAITSAIVFYVSKRKKRI